MPLATSLAVLGDHPGLLFASSAFDRTNGYLGLISLAEPSMRYRIDLRCERVHFAKGAGLCLSANRGVITTFSANTFGPDFRIRESFPLKGVPSRARVSPDGRRGAITVFVSGDSYSSHSFSTRTTLVDMATGKPIADLEEFAVTRDGQPFKSVDFNFWGVTFGQDGNRFYATLGTGGTTYLIEGTVDGRAAHVLREGVECPSLSPDDTRIAFKKRVTSTTWRLHVLDVATLADTALPETRRVDDQVEGIDNKSLAYMLPDNTPGTGSGDLWKVSAAEKSGPALTVKQAYSPAALR